MISSDIMKVFPLPDPAITTTFAFINDRSNLSKMIGIPVSYSTPIMLPPPLVFIRARPGNAMDLATAVVSMLRVILIVSVAIGIRH